MKKYLFLLAVLVLNSCNCTKEMTKSDCINKDAAIQVSNSLLKNEGKDVSLMNIEVSEKDNQFIIIYTLKDTLSLGGGAEIVINKSNCEIITKKLYQ
jgi:hypothetical protein